MRNNILHTAIVNPKSIKQAQMILTQQEPEIKCYYIFQSKHSCTCISFKESKIDKRKILRDANFHRVKKGNSLYMLGKLILLSNIIYFTQTKNVSSLTVSKLEVGALVNPFLIANLPCNERCLFQQFTGFTGIPVLQF